MIWQISECDGGQSKCVPCAQDAPCPVCGKITTIEFSTTYPDDWEVFGGVHPNNAMQPECGCDDDPNPLAQGSGPDTGIIIQFGWEYWQSDNGDECCVYAQDPFAGFIDWPTYFTIDNSSSIDDPNSDGFWATTALDFWNGSVGVQFNINSGDVNNCCNCDWDFAGGKETSLRDILDVFTDLWGFTNLEVNGFPANCEADICVYNRKPGLNQYSFQFQYFIDNQCCTNEATGLQTKIENKDEFDAPLNLQGPTDYNATIYIDSYDPLFPNNNKLEDEIITSATARDLFFRFDDQLNQTINMNGRGDVRIYGIDCNDNATLLETYLGMTFFEGDFPNCDVDLTDTVVMGGFYGRWVPDVGTPVPNYKEFRVDWEVKAWDDTVASGHIAGAHGGDPSLEPVQGGVLASGSFTVAIDPALWSCP